MITLAKWKPITEDKIQFTKTQENWDTHKGNEDTNDVLPVEVLTASRETANLLDLMECQ